jgi:hypothetical protein
MLQRVRAGSGRRGWVRFLSIFRNTLGTELEYNIFLKEVGLKGDR